jgi:hypothetical protein
MHRQGVLEILTQLNSRTNKTSVVLTVDINLDYRSASGEAVSLLFTISTFKLHTYFDIHVYHVCHGIKETVTTVGYK